jgi:hypothetical protein
MSVQSDGSESTISWKVSASAMIGAERIARERHPPPPRIPTSCCARPRGMSIDGLLGLLEQLDGAEEARVVRGALAAGVPTAVVLEELQREVERRLMRSRRFYDEREW